MTNINEDENIQKWLNEEFPLDTNIQTDEEISDDENIDCESGNDFSLPYVDEVAESMENNPFDDYLVVLDTDVQSHLPTVETLEPVVINIPATPVPGPSTNSLPPVKKIKKNLLQTNKKNKNTSSDSITSSITTNADETEESYYEPNRKWSKKNKTTDIPNYCLSTGPVDELFHGETATSVFLELLDGFLDRLVFQTNLYGTQRDKILNIKRHEMLNFIGINFFMGYHKLPSWKNYWSTCSDLGVNLISNTMPRNRFDLMLSNLHVQDNTLIPPNNTDKLFKLNPLIDYCTEKFSKSYYGTRELSIDESMIVFKGRSSMKQYNPMKPIKRGYKIWCMSDQNGYIKNFKIYQGKDEQVSDEFKHFGLGERIVLQLSKSEWNKNRCFIFDNYFTSIPLLEKLKLEGCLAYGTIRPNPKGLPKLADDTKSKRGTYDYRISDLGISVFKWKDTKTVHFASNYHGSEVTTVLRKNKTGEKNNVTCPQVVKDYNRFMGGVDHADQLRTSYGVDRKSKKWWHRLFWGILDIMFINAFVIYKERHGKIPLLVFRRQVVQGLLSEKEVITPCRAHLFQKRKNTENTEVPKKRRGKQLSVSKDVRLHNRGIHWPKFTKSRGQCELCSFKYQLQSRPFSKYLTWNVFLCCNDKKNCFAEYHDINCNE